MDLHKNRISAHVGLQRAVLVALTMLALLTMPAVSAAAEKGLSVDLTWGTGAADQTRTTTTAADAGARWLRITLNWADAEPVQGQLNPWWLAQYDQAVSHAQRAGADVIFVVSTSPQWASGSTNRDTPPLHVSDYAAFVHEMAARYAGRVAAWEIWNEENYSRFWSTGPNASAYTGLLKAAYPAVKSADQQARVLFGGLSTNDYVFVRAAYAAGAKGNFDVMALHPYSCRAPDVIVRDRAGNITHDSFLGYRSVRQVMTDNGDVSPIWFTEFGWATSSQACGVSPATQAAYLTATYGLMAADSYVQVACWYNLRNTYWDNNADTLESQFGLLNVDFSGKPAYQAFKALPPDDTRASWGPGGPVSGTGTPVAGVPTTISATAYDGVGQTGTATVTVKEDTVADVVASATRFIAHRSFVSVRARVNHRRSKQGRWTAVLVQGRLHLDSRSAHHRPNRVQIVARRLVGGSWSHRRIRTTRVSARGYFARVLRVRPGRWQIVAITDGVFSRPVVVQTG